MQSPEGIFAGFLINFSSKVVYCGILFNFVDSQLMIFPMQRLFVIILALNIFLIGRSANDFEQPDFAFPKTVISDAETVLKDSSNGLQRFKAAMEIVKAKTDIDPDSLAEMALFIHECAEKESARDLKSLYFLLYASLGIQLPDVSESVVSDAVDNALVGIEEWGSRPLSDYSLIITLPESWQTFYPKIRDFVFERAVDVCPASSEKIVDMACAAAPVDSPEWAVWITRKDSSPQSLLALYNSHPRGLVGGYLLWKYCNVADDDNIKIELLKNYLSRNAGNSLTDALRSRLDQLTAPTMLVVAPEAVYPGRDFEVKCIHSYISEVGVEILKVADSYGNNKSPQSVGTYSVSVDAEAVSDTAVVTIPGLKPGNYIVRGLSKDISSENIIPWSNLTVTDVLPFGVLLDNQYVVAVGNFENGSPEKSRTVTLANRYDDRKLTPLSAVTGMNGFADMVYSSKKNLNRGGQIKISDSKGSVMFNEGLWGNYSLQRGSSLQGVVYVSRPLYHPGDSVDWSFVVVEKNFANSSARLVTERTFDVILRDANYQAVDTVSVVTDKFGRASGRFLLPSDRLAGRYSLSVVSGQDYVCNGSFTVSDFKVPVFEVTALKVEQVDSVISVSGRAVRFSGASVPDARVDVTLRQAPMWWRWSNGSFSDMNADATTAPDGTFVVRLPLPSDIPPVGINFICEASVTSLNAEVAEAQTLFRIGKPVFMVGSSPGTEVDASKPVEVNVTTVGNDFRFKAIPVQWTLSRGNEVKYIGGCMSDSLGLRLDWSLVAPGKYSFAVSPSDTTLCNSLELGELWIYNLAGNEIPNELPLVVPETLYKDVKGESADVVFGLGTAAHVYSFVLCEGEKINYNVEMYPAGFNSLKVPVKAGKETELVLVVFKEGKTYSRRVRLVPPADVPTVRIEWECLRDKLVPGGHERWTLRLLNAKEAPQSGAMIATMYNAALNSLVSGPWPSLDGLLSAPRRFINRQFAETNFAESSFVCTDYRRVTGFAHSSPLFMYLPAVPMRNHMVYMSDMAVKMKSNVRSSVDYAVMEEAEEAALTADAGSASGEVDSDSESDFAYREPDVLQTFWMPGLSFSKDGTATISFTVPNSLGSWNFHATAWTKDMLSADLCRTFVASKPVMVEPSLPRFLRQGDKAVVAATVINNTDSASKVITTVEIFDPISGNVVSSETFTDSISANSQVLVSCSLEASPYVENIGYRVKSSNGTFTDGEQALIPVLEASTIAIDSDIFYLGENKSNFTTTIPADPSGSGIVAVRYCQNPIWDAVRALPGLYTDEPRTATSASSSVFAALTARDLFINYPEISSVIKLWKGNPADSAFVSDLRKDTDIKLASLVRTPFVGAADANELRMERFADTFNSRVIDRVLSSGLAKLRALQRPDGGFAWGAWSDESSVGLTAMVLHDLGRIRNKKLLNDNPELYEIVKKALVYFDKNLKKINRLAYAGIYSCFPGVKPSTQAGVSAIDSAVQEILADWKNHSTVQKARDALILNAFGNRSSAMSIISSLEQFAMNSPRIGVVFPSVTSVDDYTTLLEAFAALRPDSPVIDGMRKWLVLKTQTTDDLGVWNPTSLVTALIETGSNWVANPSATTGNVSIDGRPVKISPVEAATGSFSIRLEPSRSKRAITFVCPEGTPSAYGSVVSVSKVPLDEVKPKSLEGLGISVQSYALRNGEWIPASEFVLGERVRTDIRVEAKETLEYVTIACDRAACLEPVSQMPGWIFSRNVSAYREVDDSSTLLFISRLTPGVHMFSIEETAAFTGSFASGVSTLQSQYAPEMTVRSGASLFRVISKP